MTVYIWHTGSWTTRQTSLQWSQELLGSMESSAAGPMPAESLFPTAIGPETATQRTEVA